MIWKKNKYILQNWNTETYLFSEILKKRICEVLILRINKFLEIFPSTAFQARAVTGMILHLQLC